MRILALSDIHVDHPPNRLRIEGLSRQDHRDAFLVLAGDVCHDLELFERTLAGLRERFRGVAFVPGNHDCWLRGGAHRDSAEKVEAVRERCRRVDVAVEPVRVGEGREAVWVVPLEGWYDDSLYVRKPGEDPDFAGWADDHYVRWPSPPTGRTILDEILARNEPRIARRFDAPVVTFSHYLPRRDLIHELDRSFYRGRVDPRPEFNFSRVAGTAKLDEQLRRAGARVHVHGHQHRNRHRVADGVVYASRCLGYRRERQAGLVRGAEDGPLVVWERGEPAAPVRPY